ncbi:hypothetical protein GJAV_G00002700 [Gymnothorax javanicus]|nr:hypothetical protein GJAV_G00002700 [Gymnothorax javanicus]
MKFICITILLLFLSICVLHNTAQPVQEALVEETEGSKVQTEETQQTAATAVETNPLVLSRTKRHLSHLPCVFFGSKAGRRKAVGSAVASRTSRENKKNQRQIVES